MRPGSLASVDFGRLPFNAREILKFALAPTTAIHARPLRSTDVTSRIYRLTTVPEAYLFLPSGERKTTFTSVCAVIVRGDNFAEARKAIFGRPTGEPGTYEHVTVMPYISTFFDDHRVSAAKFGGWTIAATVPEVDPFGDKKE